MTENTDTDQPLCEPVAPGSPRERGLHGEFVLRHIDTLTKILANEEYLEQRRIPCGCPVSTPELVAGRRGSIDGSWDCIYSRIPTPEAGADHEAGDCLCGDPLEGSDDPLDTVAAVVLAEREGVIERYYDHRERALVATLREVIGDWRAIADLDVEVLHYLCERYGNGHGFERRRAVRLHNALTVVMECGWVDEMTLNGLPSVPYSSIQELLVGLPGITSKDAWWLLLIAFDKPVWPSCPAIDRLLVDTGLLASDTLTDDDAGQREELAEKLTDRQIRPLHRLLAAHSRNCGDHHATATCEIARFTLSYRHNQQNLARDGQTVVDLFSGAGGLSHGFTRTGATVALAVDDDDYATDTYRLNHPSVPHHRVRCEDICELAEERELLERLAPEVDILVGGPPCQALSKAGYRARLAGDEDYSVLDDPRTELYRQYVHILEQLEPAMLVMENVQGIQTEVGDTGQRVIDDVRTALEKAGYQSQAQLVDCSRYGIPQNRKRVLILGVNEDQFSDPRGMVETLFNRLESYQKGSPVTLRQALSNLPRLRRGEGGIALANRKAGRPSDYVSDNDLLDGAALSYNHRARVHPMEKDRTLFDSVMEPGDTGWEVKYEKGRDDLIEYNVGTEEDPAFKDKYRMLTWDEPAPTVVAHLAKDGNSFILPDYYQYVQYDPDRADDGRNRGITPRDAARLQSFPDSYLFLGPFTSQFRQIGNAVPPLLAEKVAEVLTDLLSDEEEATTGDKTTSTAATATDD